MVTIAILIISVFSSSHVEAIEVDNGQLESQILEYPSLSVKLQAFAARTLFRIYPERLYMITKPLPMMAEILAAALSKGSFQVGWNKPGRWIEETKVFKESDPYEIIFLGSEHLSPEIDYVNFILKDSEGKVIREVDKSFWPEYKFTMITIQCAAEYFAVKLKTLAELKID